MSIVLFLLFGGFAFYSHTHDWSEWYTITLGLLSLLFFILTLARYGLLGRRAGNAVDAIFDGIYSASTDSPCDFFDGGDD